MRCSRCGQDVQDLTPVCPRCGASLSSHFVNVENITTMDAAQPVSAGEPPLGSYAPPFMPQPTQDEVYPPQSVSPPAAAHYNSPIGAPPPKPKRNILWILVSCAGLLIVGVLALLFSGVLASPPTDTVLLFGQNVERGVKSLDLSRQGITDLEGIQVLKDLESLNLSGNLVTDLAPLYDLKQLTYLNLSDNRIENVSALSGLENLKELRLTHNKIQDISPLLSLQMLEILDVEDNPVPPEQLDAVQRALPNALVVSDVPLVPLVPTESTEPSPIPEVTPSTDNGSDGLETTQSPAPSLNLTADQLIGRWSGTLFDSEGWEWVTVFDFAENDEYTYMYGPMESEGTVTIGTYEFKNSQITLTQTPMHTLAEIVPAAEVLWIQILSYSDDGTLFVQFVDENGVPLGVDFNVKKEEFFD